MPKSASTNTAKTPTQTRTAATAKTATTAISTAATGAGTASTSACASSSAMTSSIVLAADDPAALARFYGVLLNVEPQPGLSTRHWRLPWPPGGWLEVYGPSQSRPQPSQQGRLALCLQRQADATDALGLLGDWIHAALGLGAAAQDPPRHEPFGAEAWLPDPEGNRLLLLVVHAP